MADIEKAPMGLLLVSHGGCCEGMLDTIGMLSGETEGIDALPLREGDNPAAYRARIERWLDEHGPEALILIDVMGGTPFKAVMEIARAREVHALTGLSAPMAVEASVSRAFMGTEELCSHLLEEAPKSIQSIAALMAGMAQASDHDDEEDDD